MAATPIRPVMGHAHSVCGNMVASIATMDSRVKVSLEGDFMATLSGRLTAV